MTGDHPFRESKEDVFVIMDSPLVSSDPEGRSQGEGRREEKGP